MNRVGEAISDLPEGYADNEEIPFYDERDLFLREKEVCACGKNFGVLGYGTVLTYIDNSGIMGSLILLYRKTSA